MFARMVKCFAMFLQIKSNSIGIDNVLKKYEYAAVTHRIDVHRNLEIYHYIIYQYQTDANKQG